MKIRLKKHDLSLEGDMAKVLITKGESKGAQEADLILSFDPEMANGDKEHVTVKTPGEYEIKDVLVYAMDLSNKGKIDIFALDLDGINVVYIPASVNTISSEIIDQVGLNNILLLELDKDTINQKVDLVNEFEPEVVIPFTDSPEILQKFSASLGLSIPEKQNYVSYSSNDFADEENQILSLVLLA